MKQQLIDLLIERGDKKPTVGPKKWGQAFDIMTPEVSFGMSSFGRPPDAAWSWW